MKNLSFKKESIAELNTDRMKAIDSGVHTTTIGTTSTVIITILEEIKRTTVTY